MSDYNNNPLNGFHTKPEADKEEKREGQPPQTTYTAPSQPFEATPGSDTETVQPDTAAQYPQSSTPTVSTNGSYHYAGSANPGYYSGSAVTGNTAGNAGTQTHNTGYQAAGSSYTWGSTGSGQGNVPPQYIPAAYQPKPPKEKKRGRHFGIKVVAVVLACLMVSFGSVGAFVLLIQNGVVRIDSGTGNNNAAFTINKVIESENSKVSASVSEKTPQEIAQTLIPSVVCIQNFQPASTNGLFGNGYNGFGGNGQEGTDTILPVDPTSQGSGIFYSTDGYIITNAHVVADATKLKVITHDGNTYEAELVGADTLTDLAVIKIINSEDTFTPAEFGSSEDLKVADSVMAIGNPGGIEFNSSVTMGYVSALDRDILDEASGFVMKCIQTDAAINPGNSGGALVNMYGHVVGINSSKIVATGYEGLGFAIPIDTAQPIISDLMNYGYVKDRAMLGISGTYVDSMTARFYGLSEGFYVAQLNSQDAQSSGLKEGDVITAVDDNQMTSSTTLSTFLLTKKPGDTVKLTVSRAESGETLTVELTLTESAGA